MRQNIGQRIRQARQLSHPKVTLEQLSFRLKDYGLHVSASSLGRMERGQQDIDVEQFLLIAKALHVSSSWLLGESSDPKRDDESMP